MIPKHPRVGCSPLVHSLVPSQQEHSRKIHNTLDGVDTLHLIHCSGLPGLHPASTSRNGRQENFSHFSSLWKSPARFKGSAGCLRSAIAHPSIPTSAGSPDGFQYDAAPRRNTALSAQMDQRQESSFKGFEITFKTNIN